MAPYLTLMSEEVSQGEYPLLELHNRLHYVVRGGNSWLIVHNDLTRWYTVYQQSQRWFKAGIFEALVHDLRLLLYLAAS